MKKLKMMIVAVVAALMLAGCAVSAPGFEVVGSVPPDTITALETMPVTETQQYEFGDIVYTLEQWPDGRIVTCRQAVISHEGDVVIVTHAVSDTAEALRECLPEYLAGGAETWTIDASELYSSKEAAQDMADELMSGR